MENIRTNKKYENTHLHLKLINTKKELIKQVWIHLTAALVAFFFLVLVQILWFPKCVWVKTVYTANI